MKTVGRVLCSIALLAPLVGAAQMPPTPAPWQAVVESMAQKKPPLHPDSNFDTKPLEYRSHDGQIPLVVEGTDEMAGAFCHATMVRPGWLLTAASCLCSNQAETKGIEAVLERKTTTSPGRRIKVISKATDPRIWLFQDGPLATPSACIKDRLAGPMSPTKLDLALVRLPTQIDGKAIVDERTEIEMLGANSAPVDLLYGMVEAALPQKPETTALRDVRVESVVIVKTDSSTSSGQSYPFLTPAVLAPAGKLRANSCLQPEWELVRLASTPATGTSTFSLCADLMLNVAQPDSSGVGTPGTTGSVEAQSRRGTGVVMTDHRRPVLVGVQGANDSFTTLVAPATPNGTETLAQSAFKFMSDADPLLLANKPPAADDHWIPLHAKTGSSPPAGTCKTAKIGTIEGADVYHYDSLPGIGPVYIYRQRDIWIDVRGAPKSYHRIDGRALDYKANAGYPNGNWEDVLVVGEDGNPYVQEDGEGKGFYISVTGLVDDRLGDFDVTRNVNASKIPYVTLEESWAKGGLVGKMSDYAAAIVIERDGNNQPVIGTRASGAIVANVRKGPFGAMSPVLAHALNSLGSNRKISAKTGVDPKMDVMFMVFVGTGTGRYRQEGAQQIRAKAEAYLKQAGGWPELRCLN